MINVSMSKVIKPVWGWQRNCSRCLWILLPSSIHFSPGCGAPSCCYYLELMVKMMVQRLSHHGREHSGEMERNCIQVTPFVLNLVTWFFLSTYVSLNWFCHLKWRMKTDRRIERSGEQSREFRNRLIHTWEFPLTGHSSVFALNLFPTSCSIPDLRP